MGKGQWAASHKDLLKTWLSMQVELKVKCTTLHGCSDKVNFKMWLDSLRMEDPMKGHTHSYFTLFAFIFGFAIKHHQYTLNHLLVLGPII